MPNERDRYGRRWGREDEYRRPSGREDYGRGRYEDEPRFRRASELPSVGSPGIGGGTGGEWDQRRGWPEREEPSYYGDEERFERNRTRGGMSTNAGWGRGLGGDDDRGRFGYGDEGWSPPQSGAERTARGWGSDLGRSTGGGGRGLDLGQAMRTPEQRGGFAGRGPMNYQRSDQRIHEDVCDRLTDDDDVDASDLDVKVDKCEVTLSGTVPSRDMKRRAEELAERVSGVRDVHNQIRVKSDRDRDEREPRGRNGTAREGKQSHPS